MIKFLINSNKILDTRRWYINPIDNGYECRHKSDKYVEYFELDEIRGLGVFKDREVFTPLMMFNRMLERTPKCLGFSINDWDIIRQKRGFSYKRSGVKETSGYHTNETLNSIGAEDYFNIFELPMTEKYPINKLIIERGDCSE